MEEKLIWCLKIKSGIRITNPSEEEMESYIKRAEEDMNNIENVSENWKPIVSYYSVYYTLCGILRGIGIKSENHLCSILVFKEILKMCGIDTNVVKEIFKLKNKREEAQYYLKEEKVNVKGVKGIIKEILSYKNKILLKRKSIIEKLKELIKITSEY